MKRILSLLLVLGIAGAGVGYYLWNKPHKDMKSAKADMALDAVQLFNEFNTDENAANTKYLDKTVAVSGVVKEAVKSDDGTVKITLETGQEFGVMCELDPLTQHPRTEFLAGEKITLKGTCSGFNFDVQLNRCVEVK